MIATIIGKIKSFFAQRQIEFLQEQLNAYWREMCEELESAGWDVQRIAIGDVPKFSSTYMLEKYHRVRFTRDELLRTRPLMLQELYEQLLDKGVHKVLRHRGGFDVYKIESEFYLGMGSYAVA